ncbi:MAG: enoyl-CoA hydratase-related protein [Alphaproteobacteria bacterium]|mgnify:CR=1 FL=1|nr:enoyl-CoA hydratase-related protein [Alphaproteobacteria bacterium]
MSAYEFIKTETEGRVFIVTINRPDVMNCLHPMANTEMGAAFDTFAADPELWVAIVTGEGQKAFSAGNDLKFAASGQKGAMPASGFGGLTSRYDLMKPVIAAVNGVAMGGGFEIALACDIIIGAANARFALPEPRVGFAALATGLHRLPRQVPLKKAMGMMLTGRHVLAEEGERIGFVTAVAPEGQALAEAKKWAGQILECSPMAIRATKEAAVKGLDIADFRTAFETKFDGIQRLLASSDHKEGPKAFAEKRKPNWKLEV